MANTSFSLSSIGRALQNIIENTPVIRTGGYVTLPTSPKKLLAMIAGPFVGAIGGKVSQTGKIDVWPTTEAATPQFTGTTQSLQQISPLSLGKSTILTPTPAATPPETTKTTTTTKAPGAVTPTPATQTQKSTVTQQGQAPVSGTTTPPPQTQPSTAKTGMVSMPPPAAGYSAPAPSSLPPTPVMPGEMTQPTTPENLARFEAMIRALQELAGGARYIPMPAIGAEPFGPAGALERALRRLREREVRV